MLALLLAVTPVLQDAAPTAFETELRSVLAVVGEGARGALWIGSLEGEAHLAWSTKKPATVRDWAALSDESSDERLTAGALAERAIDRLTSDAAAQLFLRSGVHPLFGSQLRAYGLQNEESSNAAFQCGSWTRRGKTIVYVAMIEIDPPEDPEKREHAQGRIAYQTGLLADAGMTAVRCVQGSMPPVFERRGAFVPMPQDAPLLEAVTGRSIRTNVGDEFLLRAVDPHEDAVVADIGCGNGSNAKHVFAALGPKGRMLLRDASSYALDNVIAKRTERFEVKKSERGDVCIAAETVDIAYMRQVWGIVSNQDTRGPFLASLLRALKPEGVVVVVQYLNSNGHAPTFARSLLAEWSAAGFDPGRRWKLYGRNRDGGSSALVFEFRRPKRRATDRR